MADLAETVNKTATVCHKWKKKESVHNLTCKAKTFMNH